MPHIPYKEAFDRAGLMGPPEKTRLRERDPSVLNLVTSSILDSNVIVPLVRLGRDLLRDDVPLDLSFEPWAEENIRGTVFEGNPDLWHAIRDVSNRNQILERHEEISEDFRRRDVIAKFGTSGAFTAIAAGALSPDNWIAPELGLARGAGVFRRAAATAAGNLAIVGGAELVFQSEQLGRTAEEGAFALTGGVILGGLLGGAAGFADRIHLVRAARQIDRLDADPDGVTRIDASDIPPEAPTGPSRNPEDERAAGLYGRARKLFRARRAEQIQAILDERAAARGELGDTPDPRAPPRLAAPEDGPIIDIEPGGVAGGSDIPGSVPPPEAVIPRMKLRRIISGGQTGVDRGALIPARERGLETGGFAPPEFMTERGPDPTLRDFGLEERPGTGNRSQDYKERTRANVESAEATLIFDLAKGGSPGTRGAISIARELGKPFLIIGRDFIKKGRLDRLAAGDKIRAWLIENQVETLNVAGPRESKQAGLGRAISETLDPLFTEAASLRGKRAATPVEPVKPIQAPTQEPPSVAIRPGVRKPAARIAVQFEDGTVVFSSKARTHGEVLLELEDAGITVGEPARSGWVDAEGTFQIGTSELALARMEDSSSPSLEFMDQIRRQVDSRFSDALQVTRQIDLGFLRSIDVDTERAPEHAPPPPSLDAIIETRAARRGTDPAAVPEGTTTEKLTIEEFFDAIPHLDPVLRADGAGPRELLREAGIATLADLRRAFLSERPNPPSVPRGTWEQLREFAFTASEHAALDQEAISLVRSDPALVKALSIALRRKPESLRKLLVVSPQDEGGVVIPSRNLAAVQAEIDALRRESETRARIADHGAQQAHSAVDQAEVELLKDPNNEAHSNRMMQAAEELEGAEGEVHYERLIADALRDEALTRPAEAARRGAQRLAKGTIDPENPDVKTTGLEDASRPAIGPEFDAAFTAGQPVRVRRARRATGEAEAALGESGTVIGVRKDMLEVRFDATPREQLEIDLGRKAEPDKAEARELARLRGRRTRTEAFTRDPDISKPIFGRKGLEPTMSGADAAGRVRQVARRELDVLVDEAGAPKLEPKVAPRATGLRQPEMPANPTPLHGTPQIGEQVAAMMGVDASMFPPEYGRSGAVNGMIRRRDNLYARFERETSKLQAEQALEYEALKKRGATDTALANRRRLQRNALGAHRKKWATKVATEEAAIDRQIRREIRDLQGIRTRVAENPLLGDFTAERIRLDQELVDIDAEIAGIEARMDTAQGMGDELALDRLADHMLELNQRRELVEISRSKTASPATRLTERALAQKPGDELRVPLHDQDEGRAPVTDPRATPEERVTQLRGKSRALTSAEIANELTDMADQILGLKREVDLDPSELLALREGNTAAAIESLAIRERVAALIAGEDPEITRMRFEARMDMANEARLNPNALFTGEQSAARDLYMDETIDSEGRRLREPRPGIEDEADIEAAQRLSEFADDLEAEAALAADEVIDDVTAGTDLDPPPVAGGIDETPETRRAQNYYSPEGRFYKLQAIAGVDARRLRKILSWSPKLRTQLSGNGLVLDLTYRLATSDLHLERHADFKPTQHTIEDKNILAKAVLISLLEKLPQQYDAYAKRVRGQPTQRGTALGALSERARRRLTSDSRVMRQHEFYAEIGKAMIRGDQHAIPEIAALAREIRARVYEPALDRMLELGMLPQRLRENIAAGYLTRIYKIEQIKARRPEFETLLAEHFEAQGTAHETAVLHAHEATNRILMSPEGRIIWEPVDIPERGTRAAHGRPLDIPDETLLSSDFIVTDIETQLRYFFRSVTPDILLGELDFNLRHGEIAKLTKEGFRPNPKLTEYLETIERNYLQQIDNAPDAASKARLMRNMSADLKDLHAMVEELRGTLGMPADPDSIAWRSMAALRRYNVLLDMGTFALSSLPDLARPVMLYGFGRVYGTMVNQMVKDWDTFKLNAREAKLFGTAADIVLSSRVGSIFDTGDLMGTRTKFERSLRGGADFMSLISLLSPWTAMMKQWTAAGVGQMMAEDLLRSAAMGVTERASLLTKLSKRGIDPAMAGRIQTMIEQRVSGGHVARNGTIHFDTESWTDRAARDAWAIAIRREVDTAIITPGVGDKPVFLSSEFGRFMFQYRSYAIAATTKSLLIGLQQPDRAFWNGTALATMLGMASIQMKAWAGGWSTPGADEWKDLAWWIRNGMDRSGVWGFPSDINNTVGLATRGGLSAGRLLMAGADPGFIFTNRTLLSDVVGPTAQTITDLGEFGGGLGDVLQGKLPAKRSLNATYRLMVLNNLFYTNRVTKSAFNQAAKAGLSLFPLEKPRPASQRKRYRRGRAQDALIRETTP